VTDPKASEERDEAPPGEDSIPRQPLLSLIPRRDVVRVVMLLLFLVVIVMLQRRSGAIVKSLGDGLFGPSQKSAPTVRLKSPAP
jgi:hypothetical protein